MPTLVVSPTQAALNQTVSVSGTAIGPFSVLMREAHETVDQGEVIYSGDTTLTAGKFSFQLGPQETGQFVMWVEDSTGSSGPSVMLTVTATPQPPPPPPPPTSPPQPGHSPWLLVAAMFAGLTALAVGSWYLTRQKTVPGLVEKEGRSRDTRGGREAADQKPAAPRATVPHNHARELKASVEPSMAERAVVTTKEIWSG